MTKTIRGTLFTLLALLCLPCAPTLASDAPALLDFQYMADVNAPPGGFVKGRLYMAEFPTEYLSGGVHPSCGGLRLQNSQGGEVPFTVLPMIHPARPEQKHPLKVTSFVDDGTIELVAEFSNTKAARPGGIVALDLGTRNRDFAYWCTVEGSSDGRSWETLKGEPVYDFSSRVDLRKTRIDLPETHHSLFRLRLSIAEQLPETLRTVGVSLADLRIMIFEQRTSLLRIDSLTALQPSLQERRETVAIQSDAFNVVSQDGESRLSFPEPIFMETIALETSSPAFSRRVEWLVSNEPGTSRLRKRGGGTLQRGPGREEALKLDLGTGFHRFQQLLMHDGDNPPLDVTGLTFTLLRRMVFFVADEDGGPYALHFGQLGETLPRFPQYDLSSMITRSNWESLDYSPAVVGTVLATAVAAQTTASPAQTAATEHTLFLFILLIVSACLALWIILLLKKSTLRNAQKDSP
ncbi:MAG: hypothetical protein KKE73_15800 [Proteobacteria bacterium]|nr:hypothetical protein [Pseudomonadota bacterium]